MLRGKVQKRTLANMKYWKAKSLRTQGRRASFKRGKEAMSGSDPERPASTIEPDQRRSIVASRTSLPLRLMGKSRLT
jgi:hypothetical protein